MSTSPAWLTIAFQTLSQVQESPERVIESGIRTLPSPHILNHLNRWARHVWRPAVSSRSLAALTRSPTREPLVALGSGPLSLLTALIEAVKRCEVSHWLDVLGVMFLADDPYVIEVGRQHNAIDIDRSAEAMRTLFERTTLLADVVVELAAKSQDFTTADVEEETSGSGEGLAELRCRMAALQLQLDDVTSVVRRNEKNTKDLLSSFHFWSLLLLDELRSYRSQDRVYHPDGRNTTEGMLETISQKMGQIVNRGSSTAGSASDSRDSRKGSSCSVESDSQGKERRPARRVFRDGKWVDL